jgi:hypothetical protein
LFFSLIIWKQVLKDRCISDGIEEDLIIDDLSFGIYYEVDYVELRLNLLVHKKILEKFSNTLSNWIWE